MNHPADKKKSKKKSSKNKKKKQKKIIEDLKLIRDFHLLCTENCIEEVRNLLANNINQHKYDFNQLAGESIVIAASKGYTDLLIYLLEIGGIVNYSNGKKLEE